MFYSSIFVFYAFDKDNQWHWTKYIKHQWFTSFFAAFSNIQFLYIVVIHKINIINCDIKGVTKTYSFNLSMANNSITARKFMIFQDLVMDQLRPNKDDWCFEGYFILCWDDLKTEAEILGMKKFGVGNK